MLLPTSRIAWLALVLAALAIAPSLDTRWLMPWAALIGLLLLVSGIDLVQLLRVRLTGSRDVRRVLSHQAWSPVGLHLTNEGPVDVRVAVHDLHPSDCRVTGQPINDLALPRDQTLSCHYQLQAPRRGIVEFAGIDTRVRTSLGLWSRAIRLPVPDDVKVFPNYAANRLFGMLLSRQHLDHMGIRRLPRPGEGSDFHQLREYRDGDSLRLIDWKATARAQKLIAREFAQERDQQIVFLLDCSVRMRHRDTSDDAVSHMDDALNAIVLLAHVAIQQGDSAGLMTFGGIDRFLPPGKGARAARHLMQGLYDIEPTQEMPDYVAAVTGIAERVRRRALIILITNLRHEDSQSALQALKRLSDRHLVLMADLRESDLDKATSATPGSVKESVLWLSAQGYREQRRQQHRLAVAGGARLLDVTPDELSASLITRYLSIKRLGQL